jgi:pSer/pThr/pTyr-binding forkhead associated (FHA) protein
LESVTLQTIKIIHVVRQYDKSVIVGRGVESGVRVTDISVSRHHAKIFWDTEGYPVIKDL